MRIVVVLFFAINALFGVSFVYPDFKQCYKRDMKSVVYFGDTKAIAVSRHYAVAYAKKSPRYHFAKYDPFLNLYLFYSKKSLYPVKLKDVNKLTLGEWLASMDDDSMYIGNFAQRGDGLDSLFKQNSKTSPNSMIVCLCCDVYGIGIGKGEFISSNFVKRFLNSKSVIYGDIGVRFKKHGKDITVSSVNPMFQGVKLRVGDIIKKIDNRSVKRVEDIENYILFQKIGRVVKIDFLREDKLMVRKIKIQKRYGGGELSDTFLENRGIFFGKNLKIKSLKNGSFGQKAGLLTGDRLLQVDGVSVSSESDVRRVFSNIDKKEVNLLFDRDDFQFFVKVAM